MGKNLKNLKGTHLRQYPIVPRGTTRRIEYPNSRKLTTAREKDSSSSRFLLSIQGEASVKTTKPMRINHIGASSARRKRRITSKGTDIFLIGLRQLSTSLVKMFFFFSQNRNDCNDCSNFDIARYWFKQDSQDLIINKGFITRIDNDELYRTIH